MKKSTIYIISLIVVVLAGVAILWQMNADDSSSTSDPAASVLTENGNVNKDFFRYNDQKFTSESLAEEQRDMGMRIQFGAEATTENSPDAVISHYRDALSADDWTVTRTVNNSTESQVEAELDNGEGYRYLLIIVASEPTEDEPATSILYSIRTVPTDQSS